MGYRKATRHHQWYNFLKEGINCLLREFHNGYLEKIGANPHTYLAMSGYLGDLSASQQKSLEEFKGMLTTETISDEVR